VTANFLNDFVKIFPKKKITPYFHLFCHHLHEIHAKVGHLNYFSAQGLEKLNDLTTNEYFLATNKSIKDNTFIIQILQRDMRISYMNNKAYWDSALVDYRAIFV